MLYFKKLLLILLLSQFALACGDITPDPLNSSPGRELSLSGSLSAQVATGDTVNYTLPVEQENIYKISVRRTFGSDPLVRVCETEGCSPTEGILFPDVNDTFDGTIIWFLTNTSSSPLYIHVGGGDESKYVISAILESTSPGGTELTADDTYGVVYVNEDVEYTLAVTQDTDYQFTAFVNDTSQITLTICSETGCPNGTAIGTGPVIDTDEGSITYTHTPTADGTVYAKVHGNVNSVFHIQGYATP